MTPRLAYPAAAAAAAVLALAGAAGTAAAQEATGEPKYADVDLPSTVRLIVAYSAGGSSDALARVTVPFWEKAVEDLTGQDISVVVENLPGAGGEIGWTNLANADADGSTIGVINLPAMPIVQAAREAGYEPWLQNFEPLAVNVIDPNIVRLAEGSGFESLSEAIEAAKQNPGTVTVGADGPLSDDHLAAYALAQATGAEFAFVPYPGGAPANRAFQSGEVQLAVGNVFDYIQTEDATKDAAILWPEPYPMVPDVETASAKLGMESAEFGSTRGFAAPAGTPQEVLDVYREAFARAFANPEYQEQAKNRNITTVEPRIGEEFGQLMEQQAEKVDDLIQYFVEGGYIEGGAQGG